jgi:hypothetical protein
LARRFFPGSTSLTGSGSAFFSLIPIGREGDVSKLSAMAGERGYSVHSCSLNAG